jgi:REP element-mobilizing transposase RayT
MRSARIKEEGSAYYHIISRVIERQQLLDNDLKERLRKLMRAVEEFSGVRILTYAILDNHFHILLHVPVRRPVEDSELLRRLALLYEPAMVKMLAGHLQQLRETCQHAAVEQFKQRYTVRMYDLSQFVKTFKQRLSQGYNRTHGRHGTLWEGRFKSLLVQGRGGQALAAIAAYIDLNAVRAGLTNDPKDYRYCGYAEAVAGSARAREGLSVVALALGQSGRWRKAAKAYRQFLHLVGETRGGTPNGRSTRAGFSHERVKAVLASGGQLSLSELLRCRVRYFSDGLVLGSCTFVEEVFHRHRRHFSAKRTTLARPMRGGLWGELCTARRLRLNVILPPVAAA